MYYYDDTTYDTIEKRIEAYNEQSVYTDVTEFSGYDRQKASDTTNFIDTEENAFKFNGNNYIEIYNAEEFDFSEGFTMEFYGNATGTIQATREGANFIGMLGIGEITEEYYSDFLKVLEGLKYIEIGRCTMTQTSNWCYMQGLCYTSRLYSKSLSSDEVWDNYIATTSYRSLK